VTLVGQTLAVARYRLDQQPDAAPGVAGRWVQRNGGTLDHGRRVSRSAVPHPSTVERDGVKGYRSCSSVTPRGATRPAGEYWSSYSRRRHASLLTAVPPARAARWRVARLRRLRLHVPSPAMADRRAVGLRQWVDEHEHGTRGHRAGARRHDEPSGSAADMHVGWAIIHARAICTA
jgi:hypothetical protein